MKTCILRYGVGNTFSIQISLEKAGFSNVVVSDSEKDLIGSDCIVLPGVGSFNIAISVLNKYRELISDFYAQGNIIFGICLGLQLFFSKSEESSGKGLNILSGKVKKFSPRVKIPQIGWNNVSIERNVRLLEDINEQDFFYFNHSFYVQPQDSNVIVGTTKYDIEFPSVISRNNLLGTQFHPEKSSKSGRKILRNLKHIIKR